MNLAFKKSSGSIMDKAVAWRTKSPYVHVELWLSGARENAECFSSRAPDGTGYKNINLTEYVCIEINGSADQMNETRFFCEGVGLKRYNWTAILGFVVPWKIDNRADMTCSEFCVLWGQRVMGMFLVDRLGVPIEARRVSPAALFKMLGRRK